MSKNLLAAAVSAAVLFASPFSAAQADEGVVTVYMPSPTGLNAKYVAQFEKQTGIKVKLFEGTTGKILARLEAEKSNPVADVVVLASWSDGLAVKQSGILASYPDAKNAEKLRSDFIDADRTLFGTSASAMGVIWNKTLIPNLNADWKELADPKFKGQIAIPDPEKSGSCKDFLAGYLYATKGDWATWEGMAKNGLAVAVPIRQRLNPSLREPKPFWLPALTTTPTRRLRRANPSAFITRPPGPL